MQAASRKNTRTKTHRHFSLRFRDPTVTRVRPPPSTPVRPHQNEAILSRAKTGRGACILIDLLGVEPSTSQLISTSRSTARTFRFSREKSQREHGSWRDAVNRPLRRRDSGHLPLSVGSVCDPLFRGCQPTPGGECWFFFGDAECDPDRRLVQPLGGTAPTSVRRYPLYTHTTPSRRIPHTAYRISHIA
jgi:hypothetical protein